MMSTVPHAFPCAAAPLRRALLVLAVAVSAAAASLPSHAAPAPAGEHAVHAVHGHHHGHHHRGALFGGSPERVARSVERMLAGIDASEAQRAEVTRIAQAAAADLQGQRQASKALRARQLQLFTQPTVDANAAEQLRQQLLAQHDQTSRRTLQAMLDISRVLSPEQRARLAERMQARHGKRAHRHAAQPSA